MDLMKKLVVSVFALLYFFSVDAQLSRFVVYFRHKGATTHTISNPSAYLSTRAIERRTRHGITIDSADLPVPASYLSQLQAIPGVTILNTSRWLNAVTVDTTNSNAIGLINALPFVQNVAAIDARAGGQGHRKSDLPITNFTASNRVQGDFFNYGAESLAEIKLHKGEFLHNIGMRGQQMHIAILDGGFLNYNTLDAMDSIIANGQVLSTWDFVNKETSVSEDHYHGMMCLSTIAANIPGQFVGKAPKASFHLFRTENTASEYPIEEFNWVCGAERADSVGADLISSSVAYNTFDDPSFNHSYNDMNGNTIICSRGADIAAKKGILVCQSVGNEGNSGWHFLLAPADADSAFAVGAVSAAGALWNGSSFGPSADGQIKPDVVSVGWNAVVQGPGNTIGVSTGTSLATPNMAGLAACLWQAFPEVNNMRIIRSLREAGSLASSPNDSMGYGIPDVKAAFARLLSEYATSSVTSTGCNSTISWNSKDVAAMKYEIERKAPGDGGYTKIGEVSAQAGNILSNRSYQYTHVLSNVAAGTVSYRIRQVIDTASATFTAVYIDTTSHILASACTTTSAPDPNAPENKISLQPNPGHGQTNLVIDIASPIPALTIRVYDAQGKMVMQIAKAKGPGKTTIPVNVENNGRGKYFVSVYDREQLLATKELLLL